MKYSIETTDYGCIETLEISNGEKYQKRTQRIKGGCRSLDDDFSDQMERRGSTKKLLRKHMKYTMISEPWILWSWQN